MALTRAQRKPTFVWQATLILLPVVVLAVFGLISLRQDKLLAELEATERAQGIADDLASRIWSELTSSNAPAFLGRHAFRIDRQGELVFPRHYAASPVTSPFPVAELAAEQARLWRDVQAADPNQLDLATATQACREF